MGQGKSWVRQALATVFSQWHFHLDLLDLWKNELGSASLALFVMGRPDDLATYQKLLDYYEQLITLFAFDTGYDPLVCIYDGEIRSTPWLYEFFAASPIYRDVSGRYYNSKLEDVNTQFTEQFLSNLALFWSVIIPDIFAHMAASAPQAIFESKANKLISLRKTTLANAGDFLKWMSHNYSLALKNYVPFIASPELWRVYNPFIDLYWWTLYGHIMCLRAFQSIEASRRIKPFIETQKTIISVNGQEYAEDRLTGDGEIQICIPKSILTETNNKICFNSYGVISCLERLNYIVYGFWNQIGLTAQWTNQSKFYFHDCDPFQPLGGPVSIRYSTAGVKIGFHFTLAEPIATVVTFKGIFNPSKTTHAIYGHGVVDTCTSSFRFAEEKWYQEITYTAHFPARRHFSVEFNPIWWGKIGTETEVYIQLLDIQPDPDYTGPYAPQYSYFTDKNPCIKYLPY